METNTLDKEYIQSNVSKEWFDDMVVNLRFDEQLFNNDILDPTKKNVYDQLINGNIQNMSIMARNMSTTYFISSLLNDYISVLVSNKKMPKKLGLDLSNSKILVWAEIFDNDDEAENNLILSQAKLNSKYSEFGFHISSTIVEECDNLELPSHYKKVLIPTR